MIPHSRVLLGRVLPFPRPIHTVATLGVLTLSESLSSVWSRLADDCELELQLLDGVADLGRAGPVVRVVAAAGEEERLEAVLRDAGSSAGEIAAVGTVPDHRLASALVRAGAAEYFALPGDYDLLRSWLRERAARAESRARRSGFAETQHAKYDFAEILGTSPTLLAALDRAARVIPHADVTVLLTGETGTGKELVARAIHYNGPRKEAPFVDINCAAIPEQLLESELFGHEKGSFTGATAAKPGLFEVANRGTLFLDEIAHLALPLQGKLLRALEERQVRRVGGTRTIDVDIRVIAATHVSLADAVQSGRFREDLFYRLNVVPVELPPLRDRRSDIRPLAEHFLDTLARQYRIPRPSLAADATAALLAHDWPGNVRELRNAMERALLLSSGGAIRAADIVLTHTARAGATWNGLPFPTTARALMRTAARRMVELSGGNKSEAARRFGVSRAKLLRLLDDAADDAGQPLAGDTDPGYFEDDA
jgi:transcriptional regulator with PAS, ATPase and Fis domain